VGVPLAQESDGTPPVRRGPMSSPESLVFSTLTGLFLSGMERTGSRRAVSQVPFAFGWITGPGSKVPNLHGCQAQCFVTAGPETTGADPDLHPPYMWTTTINGVCRMMMC